MIAISQLPREATKIDDHDWLVVDQTDIVNPITEDKGDTRKVSPTVLAAGLIQTQPMIDFVDQKVLEETQRATTVEGPVENLETGNKTNLVEAINETSRIASLAQETADTALALTSTTGKIQVFNDVVTYAADAHADILVKRYMMHSDLRDANVFMSVTFDGLVFRVFSTTAGGNLRTEIASESGTIIATIRRNTFYNSGTEGGTHQKESFTESPTTIDSAIYINSNDYSIYQIMVGGHWWEINLWCADAKEKVMMSIERRL
jgi:hypothetical protein